MKELEEYRMNLMQRLEDAAKMFRDACLAIRDPYVPLGQGSWSTHQHAVHVRDVDKLVYGLRIRQTALEDNPQFPNFNGDIYMAENYDANESLNDVLNGFVKNTEATVELLRSLPVEAWSRLSRHTSLGSELTLQIWVEKNLAHIGEHLKEVRQG